MKLLQSPISQAKVLKEGSFISDYEKKEAYSVLSLALERESIDFFQALSALPYRTMSVEGTSQDGIEEQSRLPNR